MYYVDTETCGFHGPIILLQYSREDEDQIHIHDVWKKPVGDTLRLIEQIVDEGIIAFNLVFDWFHICQTYNTLRLLPSHWIPEDHIDEYAMAERDASDQALCLKPRHSFCLYLHAIKGPYQTVMPRKDIRIRRVPTTIAYELAAYLEKEIEIKDIHFAGYTDKKERWNVETVKDDKGKVNATLKDLVLKFKSSRSLKVITKDIFGVNTTPFGDISPPRKSFPEEQGYAPYALALGTQGQWNKSWPDYGKIRIQIRHYTHNEKAREYAIDDVKYLKMLYNHFDRPPVDDLDSVLSTMVAAIRWKGYSINTDVAKREIDKLRIKIKSCPHSFNSAAVCINYIRETLTPDQISSITAKTDGSLSTKKVILEEIMSWREAEVCDKCFGEGCDYCIGGLINTETWHPAALRAKEIFDYRRDQKELEQLEKIYLARKFHVSNKIIGAKSYRMSGTDGLNAQGIISTDEIRELFTLAPDGMILNGGDFDAFEIAIMVAAYNDPMMEADIKSGKKIHAVFGTGLFPLTYEEICASKGSNVKDYYDESKRGVFSMGYGGNYATLMDRLGVTEMVARKAEENWCRRYPVWAQSRAKIFDAFCSMRQEKGIGTKITWNDPAEYIESLYGFKRYFNLENEICFKLFMLAQHPPKHWKLLKGTVIRHSKEEFQREQSISGAAQTALYAAAFNLQGANMRAAANHVIQSTGASITKMLQEDIWRLQPYGIAEFYVMPFNVHDEVMCPSKPDLVDTITQRVNQFVEQERTVVPLLEMKWKTNMATWADK